MNVVLLAGGLGTRLREETEFRPKPMVDIGGRPILWHIMKSYAHYGHSQFVLCLGYKGNVIKEYFLNYEAMNSDITLTLGQLRAIGYHDQHHEQEYNVTLADTGQNTMTGGRLARVKRYLRTITSCSRTATGSPTSISTNCWISTTNTARRRPSPRCGRRRATASSASIAAAPSSISMKSRCSTAGSMRASLSFI